MLSDVEETFVEQVLQVMGAILILAGFALAQAGKVSVDSRSYLVANFVGSALLGVLAFLDRDWGFVLLESAWAMVSLWSLVSKAGGRTAPV
jgi:hypothetical protein